jgi:hypothetical protein
MHAFVRIGLFMAAAAAFSFALAQQSPVTLDRLISIERQKALGLDQLTPAQRAGIVRLLQEAYQQGVQKGQEDRPGTHIQSPNTTRVVPPPSVIETQVDGEFNGWEGETIVKLMNGQIWQQTEYYYQYHYAYMPKVLVYSGSGGYKMKVEGVEKAVGVQRLK